LNVKCFFAEYSTKMPKVKTSWVWDFFVACPDSKDRKCKRCPYIDRSKSTTSAMAVHLRDAHKISRPADDSDEQQQNVAQAGPPPVSSLQRFLTNKMRTAEEWCTRLAVEDGLSFSQISSSEFIAKGFSNLGLKHPKSRNTVSTHVNTYIKGMVKDTKAELLKAFKNGVRFSIVIDEWTSINNHRFLNVCVVTEDTCHNLGLARCRGSMTAVRTIELLQVNYNIEV